MGRHGGKGDFSPLSQHAVKIFDTPELEVVVEVPRGSFLKRGSSGDIDFVSPLPCPFNYGAVPQYLGLEGDLLDAVVLGPRMAYGTRLRIRAWGAVVLTDRGMTDHKLICSAAPVSPEQRRNLVRFFHFYARCKGMLNLLRRRPGRNACDGWISAQQALSCARPRDASWTGPAIPY
jgi:inorganic pyrophosphatase